MQTSPLYGTSSNLLQTGPGEFDRSDSNIFYSFVGGNSTLVKLYDFTDRVNRPTPTTIFDFANCGVSGVTWKTMAGVDGSGTVFSEAFSNAGGQGTGSWVVAYNSATNTCYQLHTDNGVVTRWNCVGGSGSSCTGGTWTATDIATTTGDRITIHNAKIGKGGDWIEVTRTSCLSSANGCGNGFTNIYFWQTGTATWNACPGSTCGGHVTEGFTHLVNNGGPPVGQWTIRTYAVPNSTSLLVSPMLTACAANGFTPPCLRADQDTHPSWNYNPGDDSTPVFTSSYGPTVPFLGPWYDEIIAVTATPGPIRRFAHTFNSSQSWNFSTQYAIGAVSQDGRFYLFSSDWLGTLGSSSGDLTCTLTTNCRGDVFVVELK